MANRLREGVINYLCVVDIFNEGVDIPEVDTVSSYDRQTV
jgi:superfamily II DNA or RNA helicase